MQKKTFFFLFLLLCFMCKLNAQIVNIPDNNFKAKLISLGVDTNQDGNIQQAEALAVTNLNIRQAGIYDLSGIKLFTNLERLNCNQNSLDSIDLTGLSNLKSVFCDSSAWAFAHLDVNGLSNLDTLSCRSNPQLYSLNIGGLSNLTYLDCFRANLLILDVTDSPNLTYLDCGLNYYLTSLNVTGLSHLETLFCYTSDLTSLDVSTLTSLVSLRCDSNMISTLNLSNSPNLKLLHCSSNYLSTLSLPANTNLVELNIYSNNLTNINVSIYPNLTYLDVGLNQISNLDVSALINLEKLFLLAIPITTLDVSNCVHLQQLYFESCQNLSSVFLKNGMNELLWYGFYGVTNLQYVCADSSQISQIQNLITQANLSNVIVNSYCSYNLAGNFNNLLGKSIFDSDLNGCTSADLAYPFFSFQITEGTNINYCTTNNAGDYVVSLDSGTYQVSPILQNPTYFSASPTSTQLAYPSNDSVQTLDFCVIPNGIFPDVEVVVIPMNNAVPGFYTYYKLIVHNKGTTMASGNIGLDFQGNKMTFVNASITPSTQTANQLVWNYSNLAPFETQTITILMTLLPPPINNAADYLTFNANVTLTNDFFLNDNTSTLSQFVLNAYDPNDKTCLEGRYLNPSQIGEYLHYLVRFQNTGNAPAQKVVLVDYLNANDFDLSTLQFLSSSHPVKMKMEGNALQFHFEDIMLVDSFTNEPESHGYALFKIKTKNTLPLNYTVQNKAEIYFDYNPAIITNTALTTFAYTSAIDPEATPISFQCYPNPAKDKVTIESKSRTNVLILNVLGEVIMTKEVENKTEIDIATLPKGVYFIKEREAISGLRFVKE